MLESSTSSARKNEENVRIDLAIITSIFSPFQMKLDIYNNINRLKQNEEIISKLEIITKTNDHFKNKYNDEKKMEDNVKTENDYFRNYDFITGGGDNISLIYKYKNKLKMKSSLLETGDQLIVIFKPLDKYKKIESENTTAPSARMISLFTKGEGTTPRRTQPFHDILRAIMREGEVGSDLVQLFLDLGARYRVHRDSSENNPLSDDHNSDYDSNNENNNDSDEVLDYESSDGENEGEIELPQINRDALNTLLEMGFDETASEKALYLNNMDVNLAMEWCLEHDSDSDYTTPLTEDELREISRQNRRRRGADPALLQTLTEMGFSEEESIRALRINRNNQTNALQYLLEGRG